MHTKFLRVSLLKGGLFEDQEEDGRIRIKVDLKKRSNKNGRWVIWIRIMFNDEFRYMRCLISETVKRVHIRSSSKQLFLCITPHFLAYRIIKSVDDAVLIIIKRCGKGGGAS
jgi:hypothetical protein